MNKKLRQQVYEKYDGLCAYTGKPLGNDWQVDHMTSKYRFFFYGEKELENHIDNLMPAIKIVNHYKRSLDLEGFREYMLTFHKRLKKLPIKTVVERTKKRKEYMFEVASLFEITPDSPFDGKFYFEKIAINAAELKSVSSR